MGNDPFPEKKKRLAQSHFELNKYFAIVDVWGKEQIVERSKALWEQASQIWQGPPPRKLREEEPPEIEDEADATAARQQTAAAIALLNAVVSEVGRGSFTYYKCADGKTIHIKYSKLHKQKYYWYGINPELLPEMERIGASHIAFVLGTYGVACVPAQTVREYLSTTKTTNYPDGSIRHYHVQISREPSVDMFWSLETRRIPISKYVMQFAK
jgi:hypothetical protein